MTFDKFIEIGLTFPDVAEAMSYGTPSGKYKKKFIFRIWEDGETLVVKLD